MPLIARQRSRLAVLAVLALVGSLLAVSAVPAVAAGDEKPSQTAEYSACVAAATEDAGFPDVGSGETATAANCLSHYGITRGTGDGNFAPSQSITRVQMARFLTRAAGPAGIELEEADDQGLTDIGDLGDNSQDAINQAVALGIMSGTDGAFDPGGVVDRKGMAVMLRGFIDAANGDDYYDVSEDDTDRPFTDLGSVPFASYNSINELYELGIAAGTGGSNFSPDQLVSRGQMAKFVTRALAHTNARPAGLSMQAEASSGAEGDTIQLDVAVRDADHQPMPDVSVDIFYSASPDDAFDDDGACVSNNPKDIDGTTAADCEIDGGDGTTEPDGNLLDTELVLPEDSGSIKVWAWTGDIDDDFDLDETDSVSVEIDVTEPAESILVSDNMKENAQALKFGETLEITFQLVDENDEPVAMSGVSVTFTATEDDATTSPVRTDMRVTDMSKETDESGRAVFTFIQDDPDADEDGQDVITLSLGTVTYGADAPTMITDKTTNTLLTSGSLAMWKDEGSSFSDTSGMLTLKQAVSYHEAADAADNSVGNVVTATLVDQYGDAVRNIKVSFWSTDGGEDSDNNPYSGLAGSQEVPQGTKSTNRNGVATKSYQRLGNTAATEMIMAIVVTDCNDEAGDCTDDADTDRNESENDGPTATAIMHHWATRGETGSNLVIAVVDTDNNVIVTGTGSSASIYTYKAGVDYFQVDGVNASLEAFEKALDDTDTLTVTITGNDADDINTFNLLDS